MYNYPIDYDLYTTEEVVALIEFFSLIEDANENNVDKEKLLNKYNEYRKILNSVSAEKQTDVEFEKASGYSIYKTIQKYK